jgi:hypothetical protein
MEGLGRPWGMTDFKDFLLFHSRDCVRLALRFLLRRLHNLMTAFSIAFFASIFAVKHDCTFDYFHAQSFISSFLRAESGEKSRFAAQ